LIVLGICSRLTSQSQIHRLFTQFRILSEGGTGVTVGKQLIGKFKIEGSNDNSKWTLIHQSEDKQAEGFPQDTVVTLYIHFFSEIDINPVRGVRYRATPS